MRRTSCLWTSAPRRWCAWLGITAILAAVPGLVSAQTTRVAIGVWVEDERESSVGSLVVSVPIRSIASPSGRWGLGPVVGLGTVSDKWRRRDVPYGDVGFRVARVFPLESTLGSRLGGGVAVGIAGSAGVGAVTPYDTVVAPVPAGAGVRTWTWIPTARLEALATVRMGHRDTPAVLTYAVGRVFRWSDAGRALGLGTHWYSALGIEVSTR